LIAIVIISIVAIGIIPVIFVASSNLIDDDQKSISLTIASDNSDLRTFEQISFLIIEQVEVKNYTWKLDSVIVSHDKIFIHEFNQSHSYNLSVICEGEDFIGEGEVEFIIKNQNIYSSRSGNFIQSVNPFKGIGVSNVGHVRPGPIPPSVTVEINAEMAFGEFWIEMEMQEEGGEDERVYMETFSTNSGHFHFNEEIDISDFDTMNNDYYLRVVFWLTSAVCSSWEININTIYK
jgi:hypothetical protein